MSLSDEAKVWLEATLDAANEFSSTTLGFDLGDPQAIRRLPENLTGCFVALVGEQESLQIGLASDSAGCQTLAQALFAADEPLPDPDVSDALGEIANIIAGGVKKRRVAKTGMALGLPMVMEGHVRITDRQEIAHLDVALGDVPVRLLVVCNREQS
jgi:CheY-specific phosphatase CheX